jgi:hypothetical protein
MLSDSRNNLLRDRHLVLKETRNCLINSGFVSQQHFHLVPVRLNPVRSGIARSEVCTTIKVSPHTRARVPILVEVRKESQPLRLCAVLLQGIVVRVVCQFAAAALIRYTKLGCERCGELRGK